MTKIHRYSFKVQQFFHVTKSVICEGELAEQYIAALCNLAESCEYGNRKSELIRDCLVVGIRDMGLSKRL